MKLPEFKFIRQQGFTYLGLMLFIAIAGIGLAGAGLVWHTRVQHEREQELLFIGEQFRLAIASYYENTPSGVKQYPATLADLLLDKRFPNTHRHLRKIYTDPFTGEARWGLQIQQEKIVGIFSLSDQKPLMATFFQSSNGEKLNAYSDYKFTYTPPGNEQTASNATQPPSKDSGSGKPPTAGGGDSTPPTNTGGGDTNNNGGGGNDSSSGDKPPTNKTDCYYQNSMDQSTCSGICIRPDSATECNVCIREAKARLQACLAAVGH